LSHFFVHSPRATYYLQQLTISRASDSMFCIDFVRVTNCFYDYDYDYKVVVVTVIIAEVRSIVVPPNFVGSGQ